MKMGTQLDVNFMWFVRDANSALALENPHPTINPYRCQDPIGTPNTNFH
jgi:hypothetical protein